MNQRIRISLPVDFLGECSVNNGLGESLVRLFEDMGCQNSKNHPVTAALLKAQNESEKQKETGKSQKKKTCCKQRRHKLYEIYEKSQNILLILFNLLLYNTLKAKFRN